MQCGPMPGSDLAVAIAGLVQILRPVRHSLRANGSHLLQQMLHRGRGCLDERKGFDKVGHIHMSCPRFRHFTVSAHIARHVRKNQPYLSGPALRLANG